MAWRAACGNGICCVKEREPRAVKREDGGESDPYFQKVEKFHRHEVLLSAEYCLRNEVVCGAFYRDKEKGRWFLALSPNR